MILLRTLIVLSIMASGLVACGGTPFQHTDSKETKPGPGLFSGDDGVFTLYKNEKSKEEGTDTDDGKKQKNK